MKTINYKKLNRIVIRVPNWIGDCVMAIGGLRAIRNLCPNAHIAIVGRPWVAGLFEHLDCIDEIIAFDKTTTDKLPFGFLKFCKKLKAKQFDAAFLFQNAFEAALMVSLAGIKIKIGYNRDCRGFMLSHPIYVNRQKLLSKHEVFYYTNIIKQSFKPTTSIDSNIRLINTDKQNIIEQTFKKFNIPQHKNIIGISPGAAFGPAKRWPTNNFSELAKRLQTELNATVIITGAKADQKPTENMPGINLCAKTSLSEAIYLTAGCDIFISNDSGPMHIAAALKIPQIAIFGSTDYIRTGPFSDKAIILRDEELDCIPCRKRTCKLGTYECLSKITVQNVFNNCVKLLNNK